jgi:hypothetical protein
MIEDVEHHNRRKPVVPPDYDGIRRTHWSLKVFALVSWGGILLFVSFTGWLLAKLTAFLF